jgi:hypothetical protein
MSFWNTYLIGVSCGMWFVSSLRLFFDMRDWSKRQKAAGKNCSYAEPKARCSGAATAEPEPGIKVAHDYVWHFVETPDGWFVDTLDGRVAIAVNEADAHRNPIVLVLRSYFDSVGVDWRTR